MNPFQVSPRLVTAIGRDRIGKLIREAQLRNGYSLDDLVTKIFTINGETLYSKTTIHRCVSGQSEMNETFIELIASSGLLAPLTRDEVWAIAWDLKPAPRQDDPLLPLSSFVTELQQAVSRITAQADAERRAPLLTPTAPTTRAEAMAEFAAALRRTHPGRSPLQISAHLQRCDYCSFPVERVERFLMEQALLSHEEFVPFTFKENQLRSEDGSWYDHAYVARYFTEGGWTALGTRASGSPASLAQG